MQKTGLNFKLQESVSIMIHNEQTVLCKLYLFIALSENDAHSVLSVT